jgi:putative membrane protein
VLTWQAAAPALATPPLTDTAALESWRLTPGVLAVAVMAAAYLFGVRRAHERGIRWPAARSIAFALGLTVLLVATAGFLQTWSRSLLWIYTTQCLVLLLVAPFLLMAGRPLSLARVARGRRPDAELPGSLRVLGNPLVGPALVPLVITAVLFTPLLDDALRHPAAGWLIKFGLIAAGLLVAIPLAGEGGNPLALALALAAFVGFLELLADAIPGMVLRLDTHPLDPGWFGQRAWGPTVLHDQQTAGGILWTVAELLDLPFLILIVWQWIKADEREAAAIDAALDARPASAIVTRAVEGHEDPATPLLERPWWEQDAGVFGSRRGREFRPPP